MRRQHLGPALSAWPPDELIRRVITRDWMGRDPAVVGTTASRSGLASDKAGSWRSHDGH